MCDGVETGAQLVIFQKNIKNLHVTGQLLSIIYHYYYMAHTQITWGNLSFQVYFPRPTTPYKRTIDDAHTTATPFLKVH